jgi:glycosyltransferase involved in cell wall biosynthesis
MGDCPFVLDDWDAFHFARHIATLVEDVGLAARLGDLGRKRYQERFSTGVLRERLCEIVAEVARQPRTCSNTESVFE